MQAAACNLVDATVASTAEVASTKDVAPGAAAAKLRAAACKLHNTSIVVTHDAVSSGDATRSNTQPLSRHALMSTVLYRLALSLLQGTHALAARSVLLVLTPTHARLPEYWLRLGEACMHASDAAAAAESRNDAVAASRGTDGRVCCLHDQPLAANSAAHTQSAGEQADGHTGAGSLLLRPSPEPSAPARTGAAQNVPAQSAADATISAVAGRGGKGTADRRTPSAAANARARAAKYAEETPSAEQLATEAIAAFGNALLLMAEEEEICGAPSDEGERQERSAVKLTCCAGLAYLALQRGDAAACLAACRHYKCISDSGSSGDVASISASRSARPDGLPGGGRADAGSHNFLDSQAQRSEHEKVAEAALETLASCEAEALCMLGDAASAVRVLQAQRPHRQTGSEPVAAWRKRTNLGVAHAHNGDSASAIK